MEKIFKIDVVRPAYSSVLVKANSEREARSLAINRAHETVGLDEYSYGDFSVL